jgi:hypothetical protein
LAAYCRCFRLRVTATRSSRERALIFISYLIKITSYMCWVVIRLILERTIGDGQ